MSDSLKRGSDRQRAATRNARPPRTRFDTSPTRRSLGPGDQVVFVGGTDSPAGTVVGVVRAEVRANAGERVEAVRGYLVRQPTRAGRHVTNQFAATALRAANAP
jgi:hypothetical protein